MKSNTRDLRTCECCNGDFKPLDIKSLSDENTNEMLICTGCLEEFEQETGRTVDSDVLTVEAFAELQAFCRPEQTSENMTATRPEYRS